MRADYPRVTHPCATLLAAEATFAFDLHVLSTPPAFNLSQNQTLQFKSVSRFLPGRNQNLKDSFFPLAIHLSMNHRAFRPRHFLGADQLYVPFPRPLSTTFFQFAKIFSLRPKAVVQSRKMKNIQMPLPCQRLFAKISPLPCHITSKTT